MTWWTCSGINEITPLATVALAVATFWMAFKTAKLAKQEERHHQDASMPVCLLETLGDGGGGAGSRQDVVKFLPSTHTSTLSFYEIRGILKNVGVGPALKLRVILYCLSHNYSVSYELAPLGANETRNPSKIASPAPNGVIISFPHKSTPNIDDTAISSSCSGNWDLYLQYEDVFGNPYYTSYSTKNADIWGEFKKGVTPFCASKTIPK